MKILGISAYYHDSAAALLVDGRLVAAAQEERFTRKKHDPRFPSQAAAYCLREGGFVADDLDAVAYYEKPYRTFDRILADVMGQAPFGLGRFLDALPLWLTSRLWLRAEIEKRLNTSAPLFFVQHHESHAASAFGPSPFEDAAVLTLDGVGEWTTNALWRGKGSVLEPIHEIRYPDSLGLLYSAFTAYCGFRVNDGEYKLMGLAPYGEPVYLDAILENVVDLRADGSYALNPAMFAYRRREAMTTRAFEDLFGGPARRSGESLLRRHADLARSVQAVTEEIVLRQARFARRVTGARALCLAGGVALNCVANGRLVKERIFDDVWIQPASGDAGGAIGAAYALWLRRAQPQRARLDRDQQQGSLLGPSFTDSEMEAALRWAGLCYARYEPAQLVAKAAEALARGEVLGWFQGRMEFGPRALGNRSILADPRDPAMQSRVNLAVKFREGFRPFAPVVRERDMAAWFDMPAPSPFMLLTGQVLDARPSPLGDAEQPIGENGIRTDSPIPAVTHVDGSARVQTVPQGGNPLLESLLEGFHRSTGCAVLLNTSFNVKDEPIVCSPYDAVACYARAGIDRLVLGPYMTDRKGSIPEPPPLPVKHANDASRRRLVWVDLLVVAVGFVVLRFGFQAPRASTGVLVAGLTLALLRLAAPRARAAVETSMLAVGRIVGRILTLPVLVTLYYAVITPAGWLSRMLEVAPAPDGDSLWKAPESKDHDPTLPY